MYKQKAMVSCGIWTILPRRATEFYELARGIWQNLPQITVGPSHQQRHE